MSAIFLSASVPVAGRGHYHETANPYLIQSAVRELVVAVIRDRQIVWGGHPAITPMIWTICQDLDVAYASSFVLYQSRFFEDDFPKENERFGNVVLVDAVPDDREASLFRLREAMLSRQDVRDAVFVGGMDGVEAEYALFHRFHPHGQALPLAAPGGAARLLAEQPAHERDRGLWTLDFAALFRGRLVGETNPL